MVTCPKCDSHNVGTRVVGSLRNTIRWGGILTFLITIGTFGMGTVLLFAWLVVAMLAPKEWFCRDCGFVWRR